MLLRARSNVPAVRINDDGSLRPTWRNFRYPIQRGDLVLVVGPPFQVTFMGQSHMLFNVLVEDRQYILTARHLYSYEMFEEIRL